MGTATKLALAFAAGASVASLYTKQSGARRRALLRDKAVHATHEVAGGADVVVRDLMNRARGMLAEIRGLLREEPKQHDHVIAERVRSKLGRLCAHAHAVRVRVQEGQVTLDGDVLAEEHRGIVRGIRHVRGVRGVEDELRVHARVDRVPTRQGRPRGRRARFALLQDSWSPAWRFLAGTAGSALAIHALRSRGSLRYGTGLAGALVLLRALANSDLARLFGLRRDDLEREGIAIEKTLEVNAPVDEVFRLWSAPESFPKFMTHVREVKRMGNARYHWRVEGPAGIPFEWDSIVTALEPNALLCWESTEAAVVRSVGQVRFESVSPGVTRVHVRLHYLPPVGVVGHVIAKMFGADPKKEMDDDLLRFASLVEDGKATGRHGQVTVEEVEPEHARST